MRRSFDHAPGERLTIDMHGEPIVYEACRKFARMLIPLAHVTDEVLLTPGGRCLRLTTVFDEADADVAAGRLKGWYVASWIERSDAERLRQSWAVLEEQPPVDAGSDLAS
jgi:hypothetical protein